MKSSVRFASGIEISEQSFPIRVYALGRPGLVLDGKPLIFRGKAQKRPLSLLYCLIALGGREVPVSRLNCALWGEDKSVLRGTLDMAVHRLRHLLKYPNAVWLSNGRMTLNEQLCWVDVWAFERLLGQSVRQEDALAQAELVDRSLAIYQGGFMGEECSTEFTDDSDSAWALLARERLRSRLLRFSTAAVDNLAANGQWARVVELLVHLHELFPLDEIVCRRLMQAYIEQREAAQAIVLFKHCRQLLAKVLHTLPSPSTLAILSSIEPSQ